MTARIVALADRQARAADVRGLARLVDRVRINDETLGGQRPETVDALIAVVKRASTRPAGFGWRAIAGRCAPAFQNLSRGDQGAAGSVRPHRAGARADQVAGRQLPGEPDDAAISRAADSGAGRTIVPPEEFRQAHALLVSAVQLAGNAAQIRHEATLADDIARAWDASSAAAGALMLGARARDDMQNLLRPPQLR